jgi:hypothetical protein
MFDIPSSFFYFPSNDKKGDKMKLALVIGMMFLNGVLFASEDLKLPGERWEAKATGYRCAAFAADSNAPLSHDDFQVKFEFLRTDRTLDNGLVVASFREQDSECRYSAILLADNSASTIKLVRSHAYASAGESTCLNGKKVLDKHLADNEYLYWGHPHHVTIMMPVASAEVICGPQATHVGLDFTVSRLIK